MHAMNALAAIPLDANGTHSILFWSGVIIVLVLVLFGVVSLVKRWMNPADIPDRGVGFTLSDLKEMRDQGKISAEEYEMTRAKMVAVAKQLTEKMPAVTPRRAPAVTPPHEPRTK